jgi:hypothetical protein
MAWTQADLDRLKNAIATGAKISEFRSGDTSRKVELRSLDEMLRLKGEIEAEIPRLSPSGFSANRTVGGYDNGL